MPLNSEGPGFGCAGVGTVLLTMMICGGVCGECGSGGSSAGAVESAARARRGAGGGRTHSGARRGSTSRGTGPRTMCTCNTQHFALSSYARERTPMTF